MMTENKKKLSGYKLKVALWDFKVHFEDRKRFYVI